MVFDIKKTCRACLTETAQLSPIWDVETNSIDEKQCSSFSWKAEILNVFTKSGVSIDDQLPQHICVLCEKMLEVAHFMKQKCEKAENELEHYQSSMAAEEEHSPYAENYDDYANDESQMTHNYDDDDGEWVEIKMHDDNDAKEENNEHSDQQNPSTSHSHSVQRQGQSFVLSEQNGYNNDDENEIAPSFDENPYDDAKLVEYKTDNGNDEYQKENKRVKSSKGLNNENKRQFTCTHCGKGFTRSDNLARHVKTHTGERPHVCQICGKGFIQNTHLKAHMRTHNRA